MADTRLPALTEITALVDADVLYVVDVSNTTDHSSGSSRYITWANLTELIEDIAGALVATGGTKTGITVTYQDGTGDMDLVAGGLTVAEFSAAAIINDSESFADNDTTLMTSAAVKNKIEAYGYSTGGSSLTYTAISNGNVTMAVNTVYFGSIAGFSASRTYTTPGTCAVGDVIEIAVTTGDDDYELIVAAAGGDSISGHSTGSLRLFITGEYIKLRCVVANTTWIVDHDGRIPCKAQMKNAAAQSVNTATVAKITTGTEVYDVGDIAESSTFTVRRDGHYRAGANLIWENVTYGIQISYLYKNASNIVELTRRHADAWSHNAGTVLLSLSDGDFIDLYGYHSYGMARNVYYDAATPYLFSSFEIEEVI